MNQVVLHVWRDIRDNKRTIATTIGFASILAAVCILFSEAVFAYGPENLPKPLHSATMLLMYGDGILGGIGLIADRLIAKSRHARIV